MTDESAGLLSILFSNAFKHMLYFVVLNKSSHMLMQESKHFCYFDVQTIDNESVLVEQGGSDSDVLRSV